MSRRVSRRREQKALAAELRAEGRTWAEVADILRQRYGLNARAALRVVRGWSQARAAAEWSKRWPDDVKVAKNFSHWETWPISGYAPSLDVLDRLAQLYECSVANLVADIGDHRHLDGTRTRPSAGGGPSSVHDRHALPPARYDEPSPADDPVEDVRSELHEVLSSGVIAEASLDDWEQAVLRYGAATRDRPAGLLLSDLLADLTELRRALDRSRSASTARRLTRTVAQMSGLVSLTLVKLDQRTAFRRWARTARVAASEAGDPVTQSWVLAQEAYGHYYSGDIGEAIDVARHAQAVPGDVPCVGVPLAAALEARGHACRRDRPATRSALDYAEEAVGRLDSEAQVASAFGYNEAQLRFHAGSAYTSLRDTRAAIAEQERALELCAAGDYTDWALTRLDRATCFLHDGDPSAAVAAATETLSALTGDQRRGLIAGSARQLVEALPSPHRGRAATLELEDLLTLSGRAPGGTR